MSQAEDLLNSVSEDDTTLYTTNSETEEHIVIDNNRIITVPKPLRRIAVQYDNNIETVTFDCPRYWDDNDLSTMYLYINYENANRGNGRYLAKNVRIDEENEKMIHFEWTIGKELTLVEGKLRILVCAMKTDESGNDELHWNTEINTEMYVSEGMEFADVIPLMYPDVVNDLLTRMDTIIAADTPLLDTSLSQNGLAADAGVTGVALNKKTNYSTTVADMKLDSSLKIGDVVITQGYYEVNDGGGATYFIRDITSDDVEDNGSIHLLDNGLVAELIITDSVSVKQFGAKGDGVTDDTKAIQNTISYANGYICFPKGIYNIGNIEIPDNNIIIYENCTFNRVTHESGALIKIGNDCTIIGNIKIDGHKENYVESNEIGIEFGSNNLIYAHVESYNNSRHGIIIGSNIYANRLTAYDNGVEESIQADGIYLKNVNNSIIEHCTTYNNTRIGLTVTTYDDTTSSINKELSKNIVINNVISYGNGYIDIDFEGIQDARLSNVRGNGKVCGSESANCSYYDLEISSFYANNSNYYTVKKAGISPTGAASQVFYINGYGIHVEDVTIHDTADSYTSNTFQIKDSKETAIVKNIHIKNGNNGCVLEGCKIVKNILVDQCNNRKYAIDGRFPVDGNFEIERGLLKALFTHKPNTGYGYDNGIYKKCDVIYNSTLTELGEAGSMYVIEKWVCKETGENNSSNWIEYKSLTGN